VTMRRSDSVSRAAAGDLDCGCEAEDAPADCGLAVLATPAGGTRLVPHLGQNAKSGGETWPQEGHVFCCGVPHLGQKAKPSSTWKPHAAQFMAYASSQSEPAI